MSDYSVFVSAETFENVLFETTELFFPKYVVPSRDDLKKKKITELKKIANDLEVELTASDGTPKSKKFTKEDYIYSILNNDPISLFIETVLEKMKQAGEEQQVELEQTPAPVEEDEDETPVLAEDEEEDPEQVELGDEASIKEDETPAPVEEEEEVTPEPTEEEQVEGLIPEFEGYSYKTLPTVKALKRFIETHRVKLKRFSSKKGAYKKDDYIKSIYEHYKKKLKEIETGEVEQEVDEPFEDETSGFVIDLEGYVYDRESMSIFGKLGPKNKILSLKEADYKKLADEKRPMWHKQVKKRRLKDIPTRSEIKELVEKQQTQEPQPVQEEQVVEEKETPVVEKIAIPPPPEKPVEQKPKKKLLKKKGKKVEQKETVSKEKSPEASELQDPVEVTAPEEVSTSKETEASEDASELYDPTEATAPDEADVPKEVTAPEASELYDPADATVSSDEETESTSQEKGVFTKTDEDPKEDTKPDGDQTQIKEKPAKDVAQSTSQSIKRAFDQKVTEEQYRKYLQARKEVGQPDLTKLTQASGLPFNVVSAIIVRSKELASEYSHIATDEALKEQKKKRLLKKKK